MNILKKNNEDGLALVLSLMVMAGMTVLAIAVFTTSTTDMYIARNEKESKMAFYLAEAGIEEAMGRLDLGTTNARFAGENNAEKTQRLLGTPTYTGDSFTSADLGALTFGSYSVTIEYAIEGNETWCKPDCTTGDDNEVVLYGQDFNIGVGETGIPGTGTSPVYSISSMGRTNGGTIVNVRTYVTTTSLNIIPPAGDVFSNGEINTGGAAGIDGEAAGDPVTDCGASCSQVAQGGDVDMNLYIGMPLADVRSYADPPAPYDQSGTNAVQYYPADWSPACSSSTDIATQADIDLHICDSPASLIYIDNDGNGDAKITGGEGRGILIITGDLALSGNLLWEGAIYVMGEIKGNGTVTCFGVMMADDSVNFNGTIIVRGSAEVAASVADRVGIPRMLRWYRL